MRRPLNFWPLILPSWAQALKDREIFNLLDRDSVTRDEKSGRLNVQYVPSLDGRKFAQASQTELGPGIADSDRIWKSLSLFGVIAFPVISTIHLIDPHRDWPIFNRFTIAAQGRTSALILAALALLALNAIFVTMRFYAMDQNWQKALGKIFDPDTKARMLSVRGTLVVFRAFVKCRRYLGYLLTPAWALLVFQVFWCLHQPLSWLLSLVGFDADHSFVSDGQIWGLLAIQFALVAYLSYVRWFDTDKRDPTLHFNVLMAEESRRVDAILRGRSQT